VARVSSSDTQYPVPSPKPKGGREKKNDESDVHVPQRAAALKKKVVTENLVTYFILFLFFIDFFS
jgi:hypothetical protein